MEILAKIYSLIQWIAQGKVIGIAVLICGLTAYMWTSSFSENLQRGVIFFAIFIVPLVIIAALIAETYQKENDLKYKSKDKD